MINAIAPESIDVKVLPTLTLSERKHLPSIPACYFVTEGETIIYIGRSRNLLARWLIHGKIKYFESRGTEIRISWLECSDTTLLPSIEVALIQWFQPELNRNSKQVKVKTPKREKYPFRSRDQVTGKFRSSHPEGLDPKPISVKLSPSVKQRLKRTDGSDVSAWIREAIAEKLAREEGITA